MTIKIKQAFKKHSFKDFPIITKVAFCFIFIIILMIVISITTFLFYKNDKYKSTLSMVSQMNSQTITETDNYIQSIEDLTKTPLFYKNTIRSLYASNKNSYGFLNMQKDLNSIIDNIFSLNSNIHSVFIFNLNGDSYYTVQGGDLRKNYYPLNQAWFKKCVNKFGEPVNLPTYNLPNSYSNNFKSPFVFSTARALFSYDDSNVAGLILINSSVDVLSSYTSKLLVYPGQRIIIANKSGYVIYDTEETNITVTLKNDIYSKLLSSNFTSKNTTIDGTNYLVTKEFSKKTDWQLINIIPSKELNKSITEMSFKTSIVTLIFIAAACLIVYAIFKQMVSTLKKLSSVMKIVEKGNFDVKVPVETNDEIGHLSKTFNRMTGKIKELIDEVYINKIKQKEFEVQMLQNQINPHFIYNTLESIHMMAEINDDKEASEMSVNFGKILRYGLTNKQKIVSLRDEIKNLQAYFMLIKVRYENIEEIIIDIDPTLYDKKIIKLIFQPIVENSIYHGLSTLETGGKISILGYIKDETMVFEVSDNGSGMKPEDVESLNGYINELNENFNSIGLKNVNMRLKLYYGDDYGIIITSAEGKGTMVKITIPLNENMGDRNE